MFQKIFKLVLKNKVITIILALFIIGGGYYSYSKLSSDSGKVKYVTAAIQKGTLIISVTGSGQVSASNQADIKSKTSGDVTYINVKNGQEVAAGTLLVQLNARDAQKAVRDGEVNLESAKLGLEKLKQSSADINKLTEDGFNGISNSFLSFPAIVNDAEAIILGTTINSNQANFAFYNDFVDVNDTTNKNKIDFFVQTTRNDYADARSQYDATLILYKNTSRYADSKTVAALLDKTVDLSKALAQALKDEQNILDFIVDFASDHPRKIPSIIITYQNTLKNDIGVVNNNLSGLLTTQNNLKNVPLDIASQELAVKQRENALLDAKEKLSDYFIRAPFAGVVAKLNIKETDLISAGAVITTLITKQKIAEISLNEVDVAKIKVDQKATLTFDAINGLSIAGKVAEIDSVGTVSQGVVTYNLKIAFDTQDDRIKPGMSVSAAIITFVKTNILLAPNSAVKSQGAGSYVEIVEGEDKTTTSSANAGGIVLKNTPRHQIVEIGLASDESTEITGGLKEGDVVVTRTIQPSSTQTQSQQSALRIPGLPGGGGGRGGGLR